MSEIKNPEVKIKKQHKIGKYFHIKLCDKIVKGLIQNCENSDDELSSMLSPVQIRLLSDNRNLSLKIPHSMLLDKANTKECKLLDVCHKCKKPPQNSECETCLKIVNETPVSLLIHTMKGTTLDSPEWLYSSQNELQDAFSVECTSDVEYNSYRDITLIRLQQTSYPNQCTFGYVESVVTLSCINYDETLYYRFHVDFQLESQMLKECLDIIRLKINNPGTNPSNHLDSHQIRHLLRFFVDHLGFVAICDHLYPKKQFKQIFSELLECCTMKKQVFLNLGE